MVDVREDWIRLDGLVAVRRETAAEAVADALTLRDEVLSLGFEEFGRCDVWAARVEDDDDDRRPTLG